jgi:hypothetical protein
MANLDGLDDEEYSFNNKPDVYDMAEAFITESEEQETDFPIHPPSSRNIKIQISN